ncbi:MAG TPA: class I SAM-dependent rRNA methyltransferase [Candidatus Magasanikbacteria bacterium]|nr:class I SAM-dependent rRNA methyltransferase [Candidatus Magasanikbacteria bacterium]
MKEISGVVLKPGKEKPIKNFHHWIFSGAIESAPDFSDGDVLPVYSAAHELLGRAYFNSKTSISGRMIVWGDEVPSKMIQDRLSSAVKMRQILFSDENTNAYRLVNSEGDGLPGLVVDKYSDVLVMQIATAGIDKLKKIIVDWLIENLKPKAIYEKSDMSSRREEGIPPCEKLLFGELPKKLVVIENGNKFAVDIVGGQKTGFFLDQREMRNYVGSISKGKKILNCFGYTGGFSVYAARSGAEEVMTVDISESAVRLAEENFILNNFDTEKNGFIVADVFEYLRNEPLNFDLIILDPPAFAKKKDDVMKACRGYKDINRVVLSKMPPHSILVTSSCSYHVDPALFQQVIFQAARDARRRVRIIGRHAQVPDHPLNIFHPEGEYLKSLVLFVE